MKTKLLLAAAMAVIMAATTTIATAADTATGVRVLPESEWPSWLYLDISNGIQNCAQEGGTITSGGGRPSYCTISPKNCAQKPGWQVIQRNAVNTPGGRVNACHQMTNP
jgi:hypothetical protein